MPKAVEINIDGLVGPTHNYSGLSIGNIASTQHKAAPSNPRAAALQGLQKMKALMDLGVPQMVCPPHERPHMSFLQGLGFTGTDAKIVASALTTWPALFANSVSASNMWMANAATVSPSSDTKDKKVHFTPANLTSKLHRSLEGPFTSVLLKKLFRSEKYFVHHPPLHGHPTLGDEGAANHTRFCREVGKPGVHLFVYGKKSFLQGEEPRRYPARQTLEASQCVALNHGIKEGQVVFAQQSPLAIDSGVFHNDVVSVGHENWLLYHDKSFVDTSRVLDDLRRKYFDLTGHELSVLSVPESRVPLAEAIRTYLFNTQIVTLPNGSKVLIAPKECEESPTVKRFLGEISGKETSPIQQVVYFDLRQSMQNGGGPACLRLRVTLTENERKAAHSGAFLTDTLYPKLCRWVEKHYRDRLVLDDFADPKFLKEVRTALDELTKLLRLGSIYPFQTS